MLTTMTDQDWNTLLREPPVTTIAWRLGHVIVGVLAMRNATHFERAATDYHTFEYATGAAEALRQLDSEYRELIHHLAEIMLLRDLYRTTRGNS